MKSVVREVYSIESEKRVFIQLKMRFDAFAFAGRLMLFENPSSVLNGDAKQIGLSQRAEKKFVRRKSECRKKFSHRRSVSERNATSP